MKNLEVMAGDHLDRVVEKARTIACQTGKTVRFTFNYAEVSVPPGRSSEAILADVHAQWKADAERWRQSSEGLLAAAREAIDVARKQVRHELLMNRLPHVIGGPEPEIIDWLAQYTEVANDRRIEGKDFAYVARALNDAGYISNEFVGRDETAFRHKTVMARWIIGQAIDCLMSGMPPHPSLTHRFASEYRALSPE